MYDASGAKTREVEIDPDKLDKLVRRPLKEALIAYLASQRQDFTNQDPCSGRRWCFKAMASKGTDARQGSTRAPHWVGGGRAHGPSPRDYGYRLP